MIEIIAIIMVLIYIAVEIVAYILEKRSAKKKAKLTEHEESTFKKLLQTECELECQKETNKVLKMEIQKLKAELERKDEILKKAGVIK